MLCCVRAKEYEGWRVNEMLYSVWFFLGALATVMRVDASCW